MKNILSVLFMLVVELSFSHKIARRNFILYNVPIYYAMLRDISLDGVSDERNMLFAEYIDREVAYFLGISDYGPEADDVHFNLEIIENILNANYDNIKGLKLGIQEDFPDITDVFEVSRRGFTCNTDFCNRFGDGHHAIGICTPYSCICSTFNAEGMKCKKGLYYDPVLAICDIPTQIKICGF